MKNLEHKVTLDTKNGSSTSFSEEETLESKSLVNQVIDDLGTYREALGQAQMSGTGALEVTDRLFKFLSQSDPTTTYLTVGHPGVKVFRAGTREDIERSANLSAELNHERIQKEKASKYRI